MTRAQGVCDRDVGRYRLITDIDDVVPDANKLSARLDELVDFVQRGGTGTCVVHCAAGMSRSATVVLAYLMQHGGQRLEAALKRVWAVRPCVCPNDGFMRVLVDMEVRLFGSATVSLAEYSVWGGGEHTRLQE
mmetsp:Transcript_68591/g.161254  ORF Transcript_68591/g.161254 Transcript_68591/m.161254 type:complete len:133 (-) Transcript_68591:1741-2139(-)